MEMFNNLFNLGDKTSKHAFNCIQTLFNHKNNNKVFEA